MKKFFASLLVFALAVGLVLPSVILLVEVGIRISRMTNPILQALANLGEVILGIGWLLGTVYLSTRLAVMIFRRTPPPRV